MGSHGISPKDGLLLSDEVRVIYVRKCSQV